MAKQRRGKRRPKTERDESFIKNFGRRHGRGKAAFARYATKDIGKAETNRYHHLDNMKWEDD